jgi:hypothetical protein
LRLLLGGKIAHLQGKNRRDSQISEMKKRSVATNCIVKAYQGVRFKVPVAGEIPEKLAAVMH